MPRDTLVDVLLGLSGIRGTFLAYDDGLRTWSYSYAEVVRAAEHFAARLDAAGLRKGDAVILWSESRPEWIVALWGCLLRGVVAVPLDVRSPPEFLQQVREITGARLCVTGDDTAMAGSIECWPVRALLRPEARSGARPLPAVTLARDDVAEILFTSGATAAPKGVVIMHRNVLANLLPVEQEIAKYRRWIRPILPLRFLCLVPLSHMFGQVLAAFVPPMLGGTVWFVRGQTPREIVEHVRAHRVSVVVCVPKMLEILHAHIERQFPDTRRDPGTRHWMRRWWRYRRVHDAFGWKFWAFVVGAAPLPAELERAVRRLAFVVVQGYGLTETAPIVTFNHPLGTRVGSVGTPLAGVEVRIAADGEILVRGENVTPGYVGAAPKGTTVEDGWLHTGDIGHVDADGHLYVRGRKKEMIVTPEGLNAFPEDVEAVLCRLEGVVDAAVVGCTHGSGERVHAVLVLEPGVEAATVVAAANAKLLEHQRIRGASSWPGAVLPRTPGTHKLRRREIKSWVESGVAAESAIRAADESSVAGVISRLAAEHAEPGPPATLEQLGLSSLERVELLMAIEEEYRTTIDERKFAEARTVADLERLVAASAPEGTSGGGRAATRQDAGELPIEFPAWNRAWWARGLRRISLPTWILPAFRAVAHVEVRGVEHLDGLQGPVVFAANHQSHLDTAAVFDALPPAWRRRVAVAMAKEYFRAYFFPEPGHLTRRAKTGLLYGLAALFFNAFPLPQREAGARQALRYMGLLAAEGYSIVIFPEGRRTAHGEIAPFRPGVGLIGARLGLPVVPIRLEGFHRILHRTWRLPRRGRASITFGPAMTLEGTDYGRLAADVEAAVRALGAPPPG